MSMMEQKFSQLEMGRWKSVKDNIYIHLHIKKRKTLNSACVKENLKILQDGM